MIDRIDWGETPDSAVVPYDAYHLTVKQAEFGHSQNGKRMAIVQVQIDAPKVWAGTVITNNFVVGSDDDPEADQPETWKRRAARELKQFLVGVYGDIASLSGDPEADLAGTVGYPVGCILDVEVDNRETNSDGTANQYYGTERNRFKKWFNVSDPTSPPPGSLEGKVAAPRPGAAPARKAPSRPFGPPARPAAAPPPPDEVAEAGNGAAARPPAPPARTAPSRPAPTPPARPAAGPRPPARPA